MNNTYLKKLQDPRWQKKRLKILERDMWMCRGCGDSDNMLSVHHFYYLKDTEPWDHPDESLITLCKDCHEFESKQRSEVEKNLLKELRKLFLYQELNEITNDLKLLEAKNYDGFGRSWFKSVFKLFLTHEGIRDTVILIRRILGYNFIWIKTVLCKNSSIRNIANTDTYQEGEEFLPKDKNSEEGRINRIRINENIHRMRSIIKKLDKPVDPGIISTQREN